VGGQLLHRTLSSCEHHYACDGPFGV